MAKLDVRIDSLEAKIKALKQQKQRQDTRARALANKRTRHQELRRKILLA